ncbi:hypothetical protein [Endozoicomonas ascidiicola]|uniref:hypothetical protein n=1 Tax=Endozoicomonas ascidiicola TaxID=1698521 RepID=UPI0012FD0A63|nr:hypothetical protein [Endozoicomonas ascidiicola]
MKCTEYTAGPDPIFNIIGYLRYQYANPRARLIYESLEATDLDGGVSGINDRREFSKEQIRRALIYFKGIPDNHNEMTFLRECAKHDKVTIEFS